MASCSRICLFILTLILEVADLILDWDFYIEISGTDKIENDIKHSILGFAIFGTILFMCTFIYKFYGICNSNDYERIEENGKCASVLSLMSTLFEDFPQIILALYVAFNTEDLLSPVQIAKACYGIIEPTIQLIFYACQYRRMRNDTGARINFSMVCKVTEIVLSCVLIIFSLVLLIDLLSTHL